MDLSQRSLSLSDLALNKLQTKLKLNSESDTVSLADSFIGDSGCQVLAKFIKEHPKITNLDLRGNNISSEGLKAVAGLLRPPTSLVSLSLEWNNAHLGLEALGDALAVNTTLRSLDLRNNKIGPEGAAILAKSLTGNRTLQKLDLRWNELGQDGLVHFLALLASKATGLQQLEVAGNKAPEEVLRQIEAAIKGGNSASNDFEDRLALTSPRRSTTDQLAVHFRNRSSGSYRRKEPDLKSEPGSLSVTRLESQVADLEFALEQERKRNSELANSLTVEQRLKSEAEKKSFSLQEDLEQLQDGFAQEKQNFEWEISEERRKYSETVEELSRLQDLFSKQQDFTQDQAKDLETRLQELQQALKQAESDLAEELANKKLSQDEILRDLKSEYEARIQSKRKRNFRFNGSERSTFKH